MNEPRGFQITNKYNINAHEMINKPTTPKRKDLFFNGGSCFTVDGEAFCETICHIPLKNDEERRASRRFAACPVDTRPVTRTWQSRLTRKMVLLLTFKTVLHALLGSFVLMNVSLIF